VIALLIVRGQTLADRYFERTPWTYRAVVTSLDSLCAGESVDTIEASGLVVEATPSYDSVLRYLMKRGYSKCRYSSGAAIVIVAQRSGSFDESIQAGARSLMRERVLEPGIARYRSR